MIPKKKSHYPKTLLIKDNLWSVRFKRRIVEGGVECDGLCDPSELTIYIRMGLSRDETFSTFFHELLHAWEFEYSFDLKHSTISKLEACMLNLVKDNFVEG